MSDRLELARLRDLTLREPPQPGRAAHLSAASGLVRVNDLLYVIADDEYQLGMFSATTHEPGTLLRLRDGLLPDAKAQRKVVKPDLEALLRVPADGNFPHGALLALGSGSRPSRMTGYLLTLDAAGRSVGLRAIDCTELYDAVSNALGVAINIEGAVLSGNRLRLLQRGNKHDRRSAIVDVDFVAQASLPMAIARRDPRVLTVRWFDLGDVDGIPLSFSDATALPDGCLLFTAIAEDTRDNYADGRCAGAAIGIIDLNHELVTLQNLSTPLKIEGVESVPPVAMSSVDAIDLLLVTDADDPHIAASLYGARLRR